jgi:hypothetical protein
MLLAFVWLLLALILGASAFFIAGLVAALVGGGDVRDRVGRWYVDMAQAAMRNTALVVRETGGMELTSVSFAPKLGGDVSTIGGVKGHWRDPLAVKSTLAGKEFGIGLESASCYVSPLAAEFGDEGSRRLENGWLGSHENPESGDESVTLDYSVPTHPQILDLRQATQFLKGSCKRRWGALAERWAQLSQEKFHDRFSVGQSLLWMAAFAVGVGLAFLVMKYGAGGGGGGGITVPIMVGALFVAVIPADMDELTAALTSTKAKLAYLGAAAVGVGILLAVVAGMVWGLWSGIAVIIGLVLGVSGPWLYVRVLLTPLGKGAFGAAFFILAQLTFGAGALVRRQDGAYEWCRLREDTTGLFARLACGRRVDIAGSRDDLRSVAWAPLAVVEEKTDTNMQQFTVDESTWQTARADPAGDDGKMVETPIALADGGDGWHLDASKLERWARGSGGAELPREGRRKALEEKGGAQQISQLVTMLGAAVLMVFGFGMGAVVMML